MSRFGYIARLILIALSIMLITGVVVGCNDGSDQPDLKMIEKDIQELTYRFGDASVPPEYHRSYSVSITPGEARIVVDSYGDILAEREVDISTGLFEAVVASLVEKDIRAC
ncbi:MAG: hypothetical protein WA996_04615, partial [Candidatus Promineifilaceae bacterium]